MTASADETLSGLIDRWPNLRTYHVLQALTLLEMGDEEGARAVLAEVIKEGNLSQQAEARELLSRFEVS